MPMLMYPVTEVNRSHVRKLAIMHDLHRGRLFPSLRSQASFEPFFGCVAPSRSSLTPRSVLLFLFPAFHPYVIEVLLLIISIP
ncbi:hypothetical protein D3P07_15245 [Paenibacillus sp. 1011MAR3C5]|nr:hypothetical protein D3P07_15245 [Paenibacillus sp. 1011MAR3C5]